MGADRGGTAVGRLEYQWRPEVASQPVRLAPRPVFLAGRERLLAELDARLKGRPGQSGPRLVALCGLGGAGKTSVAIEYAHRHLAEVGVCWQFPAEDPAVLAAEFALLAAQLGAREVVDPRDPVASVHAVLARAEAPGARHPATRAAAGPRASRRLHAGHRNHPGPLPADGPGPASGPASPR